ncbi:MAG: hypothetical protein NUV77_25155 [Thermoguttaceae bacterium]|jgi:hypothetical protein|nr:hypothetical protein [Thermoguttaceae bacterium]
MNPDETFRELRLVAQVLNSLVPDPNAQMEYDALADAIFWSDERPALSAHNPDAFFCLRRVARYRTTLVLGDPDNKHLPYWLEAEKPFPNWPGFRLDRRTPSDSLKRFYERSRSEAMRTILERFDHSREAEGDITDFGKLGGNND